MCRKYFIFLVFFLMCRVSFSAFTLDTTAESGATTDSPLDMTYTCGADTKLLVLAIGNSATTARAGGAPTYNSVAMTQVGTTETGAAEGSSELWYLVRPTTGSSLILRVPNTGGSTLRLAVSSFKTKAAGVTLYTSDQTGATSSNPSLAVTTLLDGSVIVDSLADGSNTAPSGNNQTRIFSNDNGAWSNNSQYALQSTAGSITFSWTVATDDVAYVVGAFQETGGGALIRGDSLISDSSQINAK